MLLLQLIPARWCGFQLVQFSDLPQQPILFSQRSGLMGSCVIQCFSGGFPCLPQRQEGCAVNTSITIEKCSGGFWLHQALPRMLPMNFDQQSAHLTQLGRCGCRAVDPALASPLCVHGSAQEQRGLCVVQLHFAQPFPGLGCEFELCAHFCLGLLVPDGAGVSPSAQYQLQGIDQNGFSRPGFSGQNRKTR